MYRYFIYLAYNGSAYHGWQVQPNAITVQEHLEGALALLFRTPTPIVGAGRTDAGVHARLMVAHFDTEQPIASLAALTTKLNRMLPPDITIYEVRAVIPTAHARFDATSRMYKYYMTQQKDPFTGHLTARTHTLLDIEAMNHAAARLFNYTDFTSFSKLHTDVKTNNCTIMEAVWEQQGDHYIFTIRADRFLRNMVRAIVGTLVEVGRGKLDTAGFCRVIEQQDRCKAGTSMPGQALFLEDITYPQQLFLPQ